MKQWSPQQEEALAKVSAWLKDKSGPQVFRLFGWAGTGKSTLAQHLAQGVKSVRYAAFTGKAALVMRKNGCKGAST
ncbi:MAG: NB-ARC domain-containing protein, partial [Devosia sp.]